MAKAKTIYVCSDCGAQAPKWAGQCADCGAWNTLNEVVQTADSEGGSASGRLAGYAGVDRAQMQRLGEVELTAQQRVSTDNLELDRVLGGGIVPGSVILIGGDPGIGKSTLLLQTLATLQQRMTTLYVSGEESLQQIAVRASRLQVRADDMQVLAETVVERLIDQARVLRPAVLVVDSIQTMFSQAISSAPGSVSQVRESAGQLVRFAKQSGVSVIVVGHVTKEGALAGPRVLEHMVDTVLYFEGSGNDRFRVLRAVKNRFGAVNELGVLAMTDAGLKAVTNPSAIFLSGHGQQSVAGSVVTVTWEGTRPLLVEIQALVDDSPLSNPRRVNVGLEQNRLAMLLAVVHRHAGIGMFDQDVYVNVVGGMRVSETAADLPMLFAALSSFRDRAIDPELVTFGEVGLAGEIRPVPNGQDRLREAAKHGFTRAVVARQNKPKAAIAGLEVIAVSRIDEAIDYI